MRSKSNQRPMVIDTLLKTKQREERVRINKVYGESVRPPVKALNETELDIEIIEQAMRTENYIMPN